MKNYRPLLIQQLRLRLPGMQLRRLSLNRHLPEAEWVRPHAHPFSQGLLYLTGGGRQEVEGRFHTVRRGALFFLPPRCLHAFQRLGGRPPLCLAVDLDLRGVSRKRPAVSRLAQSELSEIRQHLSRLARWHAPEGDGVALRVAASILSIVDVLLGSAGWLRRPPAPLALPVVRATERILGEPGGEHLSLREVARRAGYQADSLNRILKRELGLTLGQVRARKRLEAAKRLLAGALPVHEIAGRLGFSEQNYFARWFRLQTGVPPTGWRRGGTGKWPDKKL